MKAGYSYCEATEAFQISYEIPPAQLTPGVYRNISGNQALALGFVTASQVKRASSCSWARYPITPASDILARTFSLQRLRRADLPGGRRNRRDHFLHRRGLCRRAGDHDYFRPWHGAEDRSLGPGGHDSNCLW